MKIALQRDELYGCWIWLGGCNSNGYPTWWTKTGPRDAHAEMYGRLRGKPADDLVLDHVCRRRRCVNPWHLEVVTQRENLRRRDWGYRAKLKILACGHDAFLEAARTPEGGKVCRRAECRATQQVALGGLDARLAT